MIEPIIDIIDKPIDRGSYCNRSPLSDSGAVVEFSGIVRGTEDGNRIRGIEYEVFQEMALAELKRIAQEIIERYELAELVCIHRSGFVPIHETAVYVLTAARHRREAYEANIEFIERLKKTVPIWKHPVMGTSKNSEPGFPQASSPMLFAGMTGMWRLWRFAP